LTTYNDAFNEAFNVRAAGAAAAARARRTSKLPRRPDEAHAP